MRIKINDNISATTAILTAIIILFSIRFSSYILPEKYYFSVSSVFKSDDSMMLVQHPGVSGPRFCELIKKYKLTAADLEMNRLDCTRERAEDNEGQNDQKLRAKHRSQIYDAWIDSKEQIKADLEISLDKRSLVVSIFRNLNEIDIYEKQGVVFAGRFVEQVEYSIDRAVSASITPFLMPHFSVLTEELRGELEPAVEPKNPYGDDIVVEDEQFERMRGAIAFQIAARVAAKLSANDMGDIGFEDMKDAIEEAEYYWEIESKIEDAYTNKIVGPYRDIVDKALSDENLRPPDIQEAVKSVHQEFIIENLPYYIISAVIRFAIVFLAVLAVAVTSLDNFRAQNYAFGAALAAIMLTWPVISLWNWVVREEWQALKVMFLVIYALYAVAFFSPARPQPTPPYI